MATIPYDNSPPTVVERYGVASGTSDLTGFGGMVPEGGGSRDADTMLAAGLCDSALGVLLMRLRSEWDSSAKPSRPGPRLMQALVGYVKREDLEARQAAERDGLKWKAPGDPAVRAMERAQAWYAGELRLLANSLKSKREVIEQLTCWAAWKAIRIEAVGEAVMMWLDPVCPACKGHGLRQVPGQPSLSARQCMPCGGTGNRRRPHDVSRVIQHMDYLEGVAKGSIRAKLSR